MLRGLGLLLLFLGSLLYGLRRGSLCRRRLELLTELERIRRLLEGELRCMRSPLPEAFARVGEEAAWPCGAFLQAVAEAMEGNRRSPLAEIFAEKLEHFSGSALNEGDRSLIRELGGQLGYPDLTMQQRSLELFGEKLAERRRLAAEEVREKARLYGRLGALAGLFLVILLL